MADQRPTSGTADVEGLAERLISCTAESVTRELLLEAAATIRHLQAEVLNAAFSDRLDMEAGGSPLTWKVIAETAEAGLRDLSEDHHRRGVKIIEFTEIAGAHLCRAEAAETDNTRLREELALARSLIVNAHPDTGDGSFDEVSSADLVRMVVGERDGLLRRGDVIDMLIRLGANHADQAIYGEEANARQREAMEAAFTHARCAVALMPAIGAK